MAYALMQIALAEDRDCYVMLFSSEFITYEIDSPRWTAAKRVTS